MSLILSRPIVVWDCETTGLDTQEDRVVQFGCVKVMPDGTTKEYQQLINPGRPIPPEATAIHGITDEMVKDAPRLDTVVGKNETTLAQALFNSFAGCDMAGHNLRFDLQILNAEFERLGITGFPAADVVILDTQENEARLYPRDLVTLHRKYTSTELEGAHGALTDSLGCLSVLMFQAEKEPKNTTVKALGDQLRINKRFDLANWVVIREEDNVPVWNKGKHYKAPIMDNVDYLKWSVGKDSFLPKESQRQIRLYVKWHNEQIAAKANAEPAT